MRYLISLTIIFSLFTCSALANDGQKNDFQNQSLNTDNNLSIDSLNKTIIKNENLNPKIQIMNNDVSSKPSAAISDMKDMSKTIDDKTNNTSLEKNIPINDGSEHSIQKDELAQSKSNEHKDVKSSWNNEVITISTGSITGVYYPAGGAICRMINRDKKDSRFRCGVESTAGSVYNINALRSADTDFAIVQSDWQEHAFDGNNLFKKQGPFDKLRFVFSLYNEAFTVIVRKDSDINKFDDVVGKIVNIGYPDSGVRATMETVMNIKGWKNSSFKSATEFKPEDQAQLLCDKKIDVMIISSGHPNGIVQDVMSLCESKILPIEDLDITSYIQKNGEFADTTILGGLYNGAPFDIKTFGTKATLVTTSDMDDDTVYNLTKSVFENIENYKKLHPVFYNLDPLKMALEGRIAPMHPGAVKYFTEKGYIK